MRHHYNSILLTFLHNHFKIHQNLTYISKKFKLFLVNNPNILLNTKQTKNSRCFQEEQQPSEETAVLDQSLEDEKENSGKALGSFTNNDAKNIQSIKDLVKTIE